MKRLENILKKRDCTAKAVQEKNMISQHEMLRLVRERLSDKRFEHTLRVMKEAKKLAPILGADAEKANIAALLHDVTKHMPAHEQLNYCEKAGIILGVVEKNEPKILHAITGGLLARDLCGIEDEDILNAVRYHTTGRAGMSPLEKTIYLADYIEEGRDFPGVDGLRKAVYEDINKGLLKAFDNSIWEVMQKGAMIHPDTIEGRNDVLLRR